MVLPPRPALGQQLDKASLVHPDRRAKVAKAAKDKRTTVDESHVDAKTTKRILLQARRQQDDIAQEAREHAASASSSSSIFALDQDDDDDEELRRAENETEGMDGADMVAELNIDAADERALEMFMNPEAAERTTLADLVMAKINAKKSELDADRGSSGPQSVMPDVNPKLAETFGQVGKVLSRYRSGRLPKAFKIIPNLKNWEEILFLTEVEQWSAAAIYAGTKMFVSSLSPAMAQRFVNLVLYPRVRDEIGYYRKLPPQLYMALQKSLFKPAAFFKGLLIPLCESGNCTLREAVIISSVLSKTSIPQLHSSAAMLKIAEMPYTGANSIFIRVFIDKKYALPFQVIDALVHHFYRTRTDKRQMPVLWHQSLLAFVERYKNNISEEQKDALLEILKKHRHHTITTDIRRELHAHVGDTEMGNA